MYEELEFWKKHKEEKELQSKIAQEYGLFHECGFQYKEKAKQNVSKLVPLEYEYLLDELCTKEMSGKEFDKELDKLVERLNK
jgi:hypothetical protein